MLANERAHQAIEALARVGIEQRRGPMRLVLMRPPELVTNRHGEVVGVDAWVRLYDGNDEVPIDPHRVIVNPPLGVVDRPPVFDVAGNLVAAPVVVRDPVAAFWDTLWDSVQETPNPAGWNTDGTVTTVFSSPADGFLFTEDPLYEGARNGAITPAVDVASTLFITGQEAHRIVPGFDFVRYRCYEAFLSFNTSSIPDTDRVTQVQLALFLEFIQSDSAWTLEARQNTWSSDGLTASDWIPGADLGSKTLLASITSAQLGSAGSYKTLTSQSSFLTVTGMKTGTVEIILHSDQLRLGTVPAADSISGARFYSADDSGTSRDPKLTITHELVVPTKVRFNNTWIAVRPKVRSGGAWVQASRSLVRVGGSWIPS